MGQSVGDGHLAYNEPLTVRYSTSFREVLLGGFEDSGGYELDLGADAPADLSAVQVILAARAFAKDRGKTFALARPAAGPLAEVLRQGGFLDEAAADDRAFWLQNEEV
ncbi:MAG: STAS domain-containing protein [Caulobacteraceae bacterium]|nr:STAS domain-containing protein [Caulobacteraceae bacterium]